MSCRLLYWDLINRVLSGGGSIPPKCSAFPLQEMNWLTWCGHLHTWTRFEKAANAVRREGASGMDAVSYP